MPHRTRLVALSLFVVFAGAAVVLALPDGQPDIAGDWTAKVKFKGFATEADGDNDKGKVTVTLRFRQEDEELEVEVIVPGEDSFTMAGEIGNGHFWATGTTVGGRPRMMVGHIAKNGKKMKGMLLEAWDDMVDEVKFSAKPEKK
jgi:hypothetical protein